VRIKMRLNSSWHIRLTSALPLAGVIVAVLAASPLFAQKETGGYPEDWSHHHLVFSNPGTLADAEKSGTSNDWHKIVTDPRYIHQQNKRSSGAKTLVDPGGFVGSGDRGRQDGGSGLHQDWAQTMLVGTVQPNTFPAKWSFSTTTAVCASDFVVYPTGAAGTATAASIIAYSNLYSGCGGTVPSVYWAYDTGATISTSPVLSGDSSGSQLAFVQVSGTTASLVLLKWNANTTGRAVTGVLSASSPEVTISSGTFTQADVGAQISGTNIPAGDTIASVLSGTTANLATAPTAHASETLTITAEAVATPGAPPTVANGSYRACTAPCMTTLTFSGSHNDTFSAPFYDYNDDVIYVGDDSGNLHQFTGVFNGSPAETVSAVAPIWPVVLNATYKVTSPVFDPVSGYVFVGNTDGILYAVNPTTATIHGTSTALGGAIMDGPLVDSSAGMVYVFVTINSADDNAVFQFSTTFTTGTGNGSATVGTGGTAATQFWLYAGTFDNVYYQSTTSPHTGSLWVGGNTSSATGGGAVYRIPITANVMTTGTIAAAITGITGNHNSWLPPLTEFCNPGANAACALNAGQTATTTGTDYLFFSANRGPAAGGCTNANGNGCIFSYNISTPTGPTRATTNLNVTNVGSPGCWATGGIVIDNSVQTGTLAGASQIYFIGLNGDKAGGPTSGTYTSTGCTAGSAGATIHATQALQSGP
jgi:hypothetical protein